MRAYKCDRCGALYEKTQERTGQLHITISRSREGCGLDLCPRCDNDFRTWFNLCVDERRASTIIEADMESEE